MSVSAKHLSDLNTRRTGRSRFNQLFSDLQADTTGGVGSFRSALGPVSSGCDLIWPPHWRKAAGNSATTRAGLRNQGLRCASRPHVRRSSHLPHQVAQGSSSSRYACDLTSCPVSCYHHQYHHHYFGTLHSGYGWKNSEKNEWINTIYPLQELRG